MTQPQQQQTKENEELKKQQAQDRKNG